MLTAPGFSGRVAVYRKTGLLRSLAYPFVTHTRNACLRHTRASSSIGRMQARASADVFALDFDGVLVDSEPEISSSAVAAAAEYWPKQFGSLDKASLDGVREKLRIIRPVLVHGVESLIMVRCDRQFCLPSYTTAMC